MPFRDLDGGNVLLHPMRLQVCRVDSVGVIITIGVSLQQLSLMSQWAEGIFYSSVHNPLVGTLTMFVCKFLWKLRVP